MARSVDPLKSFVSSSHQAQTHSRWKNWQVYARLLTPGMNTYEVVKHFHELTQLPRPSEKEAKAETPASEASLSHIPTPVEKLKSYSPDAGIYSKWEARALALPFIGNAMILYKMYKSENKERTQEVQQTLSPQLETELIKSFDSGEISDKINIKELNGTRLGKTLCTWAENHAQASEADPSQSRNWREDPNIKRIITSLIGQDQAGKLECTKQFIHEIKPMVDAEFRKRELNKLQELRARDPELTEAEKHRELETFKTEECARLMAWLQECSQVPIPEIEMAILEAKWENVEGITIETRWKYDTEATESGTKETDIMHALRYFASREESEPTTKEQVRRQALTRGFNEHCEDILLREDLGNVVQKLEQDQNLDHFANTIFFKAFSKMQEPFVSQLFSKHGQAITEAFSTFFELDVRPAAGSAEAAVASAEVKAPTPRSALNRIHFVCTLLEKSTLTPAERGIFFKELSKNIDILKNELDKPELTPSQRKDYFHASAQVLVAFNNFKPVDLKTIQENEDGNYGNQLSPVDRRSLSELFATSKNMLDNYVTYNNKAEKELTKDDQLLIKYITYVEQKLFPSKVEQASSPEVAQGKLGRFIAGAREKLGQAANLVDKATDIVLNFRDKYENNKSSFITDPNKFSEWIKNYQNDITKALKGEDQKNVVLRENIQREVLFQLPVAVRKKFIQDVMVSLLAEDSPNAKENLQVMMKFLKECYNTDAEGRPLRGDDSDSFDRWAETCCPAAFQLVGEPRKGPVRVEGAGTPRTEEVSLTPSKIHSAQAATAAVSSVEPVIIRQKIEKIRNDIESLAEMVKQPISTDVEEAFIFHLDAILKDEEILKDMYSILYDNEIKTLQENIAILKAVTDRTTIKYMSDKFTEKEFENLEKHINTLKKRDKKENYEQSYKEAIEMLDGKLSKNEITSQEYKELKEHIESLKEYNQKENYNTMLEEVLKQIQVYINSPDASSLCTIKISSGLLTSTLFRIDDNLNDTNKEFTDYRVRETVSKEIKELTSELNDMEAEINKSLETNRKLEKDLAFEMLKLKIPTTRNASDMKNKKKQESAIKKEISELTQNLENLKNARRLLDTRMMEVKKLISIDPQQQEPALLKLQDPKEKLKDPKERLKVAKQLLSTQVLEFFNYLESPELGKNIKEKINVEYEEKRKAHLEERHKDGFDTKIKNHIEKRQKDISIKKQTVDAKLRALKDLVTVGELDIPGLREVSDNLSSQQEQQVLLQKQSDDLQKELEFLERYKVDVNKGQNLTDNELVELMNEDYERIHLENRNRQLKNVEAKPSRFGASDKEKDPKQGG